MIKSVKLNYLKKKLQESESVTFNIIEKNKTTILYDS